MLTIGSLCSGAGGMDLGFHQAGHRTLWMCEIDEWRRRLLNAHFGVSVHPDLTTLDPAVLKRPDILIGGTPCQDLSVAGQRAGLDGERSGLFWHFMRVRNHLGAEWTVWENVAGALSSNNGLDFASVLGAFVGADVAVPGGGWPGAGVAAGPWGGAVWRILDAQHFGVPQRRRRIFVVGRLGGPCPPEVLLEPTGGGRDPAARRSAGAGAASAPSDRPVGALTAPRNGAGGSYRLDAHDVDSGHLQVVSTLQARGSTGGFDVDPAMAAGGHLIAATLKSSGVSGGRTSDVEQTLIAHTLRAEGFDASEDGTGRGTPLTVVDGAQVDADGVRAPDGLAGRVDGAPVSFAQNQRGEVLAKPIMDSLKVGGRKPGQGYPAVAINLRGRGEGARPELSDVASLRAANGGSSRSYVMGDGLEVDRCAYDSQPDGRRYAACGDGVVASVAEWIGRRLAAAIDGANP